MSSEGLFPETSIENDDVRTPPGGERGQAQILYCNDRELLLRSGNFFFLFPAAELNHAVSYLNPAFDFSVRRAIIRLVRPGSIFVDIGSNVGIVAAIAGRRAGRSGTVITVEPVPALTEFVKRNVFLNAPLVEHRHFSVAAGKTETTTVLQSFQWDSRSSSIFPEISSLRPDVEMMEVDAIPASRLVPDRDHRNLVVKIDAEGAEFDILTDLFAGALRERSATLIIEYAPDHIVRAGHSVEKLIELIYDAGYVAHFLMKNGMPGVEVETRLLARSGNLVLSRAATGPSQPRLR